MTVISTCIITGSNGHMGQSSVQTFLAHITTDYRGGGGGQILI